MKPDVPKSLLMLHNRDARDLKDVLAKHEAPEKFIDVTITSPPYFDLKSYGYENQVGHGQKYSQYLDDLKEIFKQTYLITKDTGSLWLIVDTFSKNGNFVNLPFEIAQRLENLFEKRLEDNKTKKIGWKLTDLVIWKKDKTLPWSRRGQFRNIFEFVLFFTKSNKFKFYIDRIRILDFSDLKQWWVNFPERYNPEGVVPTNVWEYPIPTQGIWASRTLRHFNPLPPKMIERILLLTTDLGDVVFDPFAGSGTTLSVADFWKRKWFGFEMNKKYCEMFGKVLEETRHDMLIEKQRIDEREILRNKFRQTIRNLRLVKFPKTLMRELNRRGALASPNQLVGTVFALSPEKENHEQKTSKFPKNKFMTEDIFLILNNLNEKESLRKHINSVISKAPLSKFGIESRIFLQDRDEFVSQHKEALENMNLWLYSFGVVRKFARPITFSNWIYESEKPKWVTYVKNAVPPIISNVSVNQEVPKSWESRENKHNILLEIFRTLFP